MAGVYIFERSFWNTPWQEVVDPDAPLVEIALGTLSPLFNGWAHQNIDGTYTVFLGEDVVLNEIGEPYLGTLQGVVRMSQIVEYHPDDVLALFDGPFDPLAVCNAFHQGGEALFDTLFAGDDVVDIDNPPTGGAPMDAPAIDSGPGDDTINGSEHHDTVRAGKGDDDIFGDDGDDVLRGQGGRDEIDGGDGDDTLYGGNGADSILGGNGDNTINGGGGADTIIGGGDEDVINGGKGGDVLKGRNGDDVISGDGGDDTLAGQFGEDTLNGGRGKDLLRGDDGDDRLDGYLGQDELKGGDGNDTLIGGGGDDRIYGDDGFDSALFLQPRAHCQVNVDDFYVEVRALSGNEGIDLLFDVERLLFTDEIMFV